MTSERLTVIWVLVPFIGHCLWLMIKNTGFKDIERFQMLLGSLAVLLVAGAVGVTSNTFAGSSSRSSGVIICGHSAGVLRKLQRLNCSFP